MKDSERRLFHFPRQPEGTPLLGDPEFENVGQERDYWKALALSYAAKIAALRHALAEEWAIQEGMIVQVGGGPRQAPTLAEVVEGLNAGAILDAKQAMGDAPLPPGTTIVMQAKE